jgi:hypothetical protein
MSNRSPDDLTRSEVKQRNPIGMDYRADHAEHKQCFPVKPLLSLHRYRTFAAAIGAKSVSEGSTNRRDWDVIAIPILLQRGQPVSESAGRCAAVQTLDRVAATQE